MDNHFKKKLILFMRKCRKNAGFSLIELIIAVCILAVIVVPILHSFVTAANTSAKSQKIGEATDAADNIMELLNSTSVEKFMSCNESLSNILTAGNTDTVTITPDDDNGLPDDSGKIPAEKYFYINNLKSGSSKFDAKVTITPGTETEHTGFYELNNKDIASYIDPDGSFVQPYERDSNPDSTSDDSVTYSQFKARSGVATFKNKERSIRIDISQSNNKVYVYITYYYMFTYVGLKSEATTIISRKYAVFPGGQAKKADGTPVSAYIMYYPFFSQNLDIDEDNGTKQGKGKAIINTTDNNGVSVKFFEGRDTIQIYNNGDVPIKLFLVKQWPAQYNKTTASYDMMSDADLLKLEMNYETSIEEFHSREYADGYQNQLYTNAAYYLSDNVVYAGKKIATVGSNYYHIITNPGQESPSSADKLKGDLINLEKFDRIYYVQIDIYKAGKMEDSEPIYSMSGSALK